MEGCCQSLQLVLLISACGHGVASSLKPWLLWFVFSLSPPWSFLLSPCCPGDLLFRSAISCHFGKKSSSQSFLLIMQCGLQWSNFLLYLFLFFVWIIFNACCLVHAITSTWLFKPILLTLPLHPSSACSFSAVHFNTIGFVLNTHMLLLRGFCRAFPLRSKARLEIQLALLFVESTACYTALSSRN